jgi:YgiT-type zinc finger domain-containing protein
MLPIASESEATMTTTVPTTTAMDHPCAGTYELEYRPVVRRVAGALAIIADVPIWRCPICGEDYLELATVRQLESLAAAPPEAIGHAPIYRYPAEEAQR